MSEAPVPTHVASARGLVKTYKGSGERAVNGIDFDVRARECFGFLGPNGAGKTTTMRMVSCTAQRSAGELSVLGLDPSRAAREIKRRIGVVPQETNLDGVLSVEENLLVHARYFDMDSAAARSAVTDALEFVQLSDRADWNINHLSGGMKRRLLIARGLVNDPKLLILGEPTTGLDPQARHLVWEKLRDLKRRGVTLVLTTHYMEEAAQLCDRLVIMHQGRILVEGRPAELVRTHLAPEVVELTAADAGALQLLESSIGFYGWEHEIAGDRLIVHVDDADGVLKTVADAGVDYETATVRPASLEDLFLNLTGRSLLE